ncbi:Z-ring formation inhibitor MciZ [Bacillus sp. V59.32b]|uniref:Z-ring formation inhibitor MciZ n=1 Tax=Bacillus sp. V59.32b TaxID=1758642 RepID=UPI000E3EAB66|nr:Z-ring formation inhibitor MciZ [Bacillus sp. V59.32b]RFU69185.1 Z-ring formation inhibitor MciZ [Bacillus sp. V59.32b]
MKVYVLDKGIVLVGKGWEIREKLKEYQNQYAYVNDWVRDVHRQAPAKRVK